MPGCQCFFALLLILEVMTGYSHQLDEEWSTGSNITETSPIIRSNDHSSTVLLVLICVITCAICMCVFLATKNTNELQEQESTTTSTRKAKGSRQWSTAKSMSNKSVVLAPPKATYATDQTVSFNVAIDGKSVGTVEVKLYFEKVTSVADSFFNLFQEGSFDKAEIIIVPGERIEVRGVLGGLINTLDSKDRKLSHRQYTLSTCTRSGEPQIGHFSICGRNLPERDADYIVFGCVMKNSRKIIDNIVHGGHPDGQMHFQAVHTFHKVMIGDV